VRVERRCGIVLLKRISMIQKMYCTLQLMLLLILLQPSDANWAVAQQPKTDTPVCFTMHVYRDAVRIDNPYSVLFKAGSDIKNIKAVDGKFCVPSEMRGLTTINVGFVLGEDLFDFGDITMYRLGIPWDIYFGGKKFTKKLGHLKSIKTKTACEIEFLAGEPGIGEIISPCRSNLGTRTFPAPE
jgi:hypothetical protein